MATYQSPNDEAAQTDDAQTTLSDNGRWETSLAEHSETETDSLTGRDSTTATASTQLDEAQDEDGSDPRPPNIADIELTRATSCTERRLNSRQLAIWERELQAFAEWMSARGLDPDNHRGMAEETVQNTIKRIDKIARWWWDNHSIVLHLDHEAADAYNDALATDNITKQNGEAYATSSKDKDTEALQKYHEWRAYERGGNTWEPRHKFEAKTTQHADSFSKDERQLIRETALEYDSLPSYDDVSPQQRDQLNQYLSMRLEKPKAEVRPDDWERVGQSWEIPSLIWTALDAGWRPIEVKRSTTNWPRLEKSAFFVPKELAAKGRENWECALRPQSVQIMSYWLEERAHLTKYQGRDALWLTREGNPYSSDSLCYLLDQLCEAAGIDQSNRQISWYSIRHSVGDHMTPEGGLQQTKEQLRHKSLQSTLRYQSPTIDDRQDTLNQMG